MNYTIQGSPAYASSFISLFLLLTFSYKLSVMPLFYLSFNIDMITLMGIIGLSMLAGFLLRTSQLRKKNRQICELEKEMVKAHAEVLTFQKEYCDLESRIQDPAIPVISMKHTAKEEEKKKQQLPDDSPERKSRPTRTA